MKNRYRESAIFKIITGVTTTLFLGLSISAPALAFDPEFSRGEYSGRVFGLSLSGNLDFTDFKIVGFSHQPIDGLNGTSSNSSDSFFTIEENLVKTQMPLVTIGKNIKNPGILYNHNGTQFYEHIVNAASGEEKSESMVGLYVLGAAAMGAIIFAMASSSSSDDKETTEPINGEAETISVNEENTADPVDEAVEETPSPSDSTITPPSTPEDNGTP